MGVIKQKRVGRRMASAANSPEPSGPMCGHGDCGADCKVRYVGPTSHMRDHHIIHAAKGVAHVWSAAIVTGFALVLTGAIALTAAQASTDAKLSVSQSGVKQDLGREIRQLNAKLDAMNATVQKLSRTCAPTADSDSSEE